MILTVVNSMDSTYQGWFEIQELVNNGKYKSLFPVGTEIVFQLKNGETATVVVRAVDHYQSGELVFGFKRLYFGYYPVIESCNSEKNIINDFLNEVILYDILPDGLSKIISPKNQDKLWLPTEYEVCGNSVCSAIHERSESQFKSYEDVFERIMFNRHADQSLWWTSSRSAANSHDFVACGLSSLSCCEMGDEELGIVPHFLIRKEEIS